MYLRKICFALSVACPLAALYVLSGCDAPTVEGVNLRSAQRADDSEEPESDEDETEPEPEADTTKKNAEPAPKTETKEAEPSGVDAGPAPVHVQCAFGDGLYCGGHGVTGDRKVLFRCTNRVPTPDRTCTTACVKRAPGTGDVCSGE